MSNAAIIKVKNSMWFERRIVINDIRQISRKKLDFAKLTETRSDIS